MTLLATFSSLMRRSSRETDAMQATQRLETFSVAELIRDAHENPPEPILERLLNNGDVLLIHGPEESFKSIFILQMAESIATGKALFNAFPVRRRKTVGVIETEIHKAMLGQRLAKMFPHGNPPPDNLVFLGSNALKDWRRESMSGKFQFIKEWVEQERIEVLAIDIASDFFRRDDNPNVEQDAGGFFDEIRNMGLDASILVRHDRKRREGDDNNHPNEVIRGSGEWKEDPEAIIHLKRTDRRTQKVAWDVGKLRYFAKPEPLDVWFDAGCFRLTPLPPVIAVLEQGVKTRTEVVRECRERFGVEERSVDAQLTEQVNFLQRGQEGHERTWVLNGETVPDAPWANFLLHMPER